MLNREVPLASSMVVAGDVQFLGPRKDAPTTEATGTPQVANEEVSPEEIPF